MEPIYAHRCENATVGKNGLTGLASHGFLLNVLDLHIEIINVLDLHIEIKKFTTKTHFDHKLDDLYL